MLTMTSHSHIAALDPALQEARAPAVDASRRAAIWEVVQSRLSAQHIVRAHEGEWRCLLPGVEIKRLYLDPTTHIETSLWRIQAGAYVPPHPHSHDEECLVLEGSIVDGDNCFDAGDYVLARAGSMHARLSSPQGALLLIRSQVH